MTLEEILKQYEKENQKLVCQPPAYLLEKQQGEYTIEDYYNIPDDIRVELIDGVIYGMSSPSYVHQIISIKIAAMLEDYIEKNAGRCKVFAAPLDVRLDKDDKTILQPDVGVVCDQEKNTQKGVVGAPDFIVEIVSPATKKKDTTIKFQKYKQAGVKEYWVVDPEHKVVRVYELVKNDEVTLYGFENHVPVGIFDGKCSIDFSKIYKRVEEFYNDKK